MTITHYVTVGIRRVYYQFDTAMEMQDTYRSYSGRGVLIKRLDLINGLDKLAIL